MAHAASTYSWKPRGGNEAYWATCLAAIQDDPAGFVIDARFIQESEIPGIIADSDAFVLAYQNFESQSGVAVLAGLSGRPVIATGMDGFLELQQQGLVMFQIPGKGTPADIVAGIEKLQIASLTQLREQTSNGELRLQHSLSVKRVASLVLDAAKRSKSMIPKVARLF
jgi:glycosyltransferase involved in cell wall biosynthesis